MAFIMVGCTGEGKSYICNRIFRAYNSNNVFKTSAKSSSETSRIQSGNISLENNRNVTIIDTPGFYDTNGINSEQINVCKIWKALESCTSIYAILFVFTNRFSMPIKLWYDRIMNTVPNQYHKNIVIVHNKFDGEEDEKGPDIQQIRDQTGNLAVNVCHIEYNPSDDVIKNLVNQWITFPTFTIKNMPVPEICYEKDENGPVMEKFVKHIDETKIETVVRSIDHSGYRVVGREWDGTVGKWLGRKKDKVRWVTDIQNVEEMLPVTHTKEQWVKYQDIFRIRFDGTRDFQNERQIEFFLR